MKVPRRQLEQSPASRGLAFLNEPILQRKAWCESQLFRQQELRIEVLLARCISCSINSEIHEINVMGKGDVEGRVPLSETLMADFARYRRFLGLPTPPEGRGQRPLIMGIAGHEAALTPTAVYLIVKDTFGRIAAI
jgi:hypothetical protein